MTDVSKRSDRLLRSGQPVAMGCLDDSTLDDLVEGRLSGERLAQADQHVDACATCRTIVTTLAAGRAPSGERSVPAAGTDAAIEPGARIGRYVVERHIGGGGMGDVYEAHDPDLDRRVAVKVLRRDATAPAAVIEERMRREAQAMARLAHPNVVAVYDVGQAGGRIWLAMELVEGVTLREWMRQRRSWQDVCAVFVQAGRGLAAAHDAGLVHRDFKPENVIVGADGRVRVTDFGLARVTLDDAEAHAHGVQANGSDAGGALTLTGAVLGTPAYMAPEQLAGGAADAASDQFAFGVALFEALHGQRPFMASSIDELRRAMEEEPRTPPGASAAPGWLDRAVTRALSRVASDRWPSMRALLVALDAERFRRRRTLAAAGAAVVALLAVTAAGASWLARGGSAAGLPGGSASKACEGGATRIAAVWNPERSARIHAAFSATGSPIADGAAAAVAKALDAFAEKWAATHDATCSATDLGRETSRPLLDPRTECLRRRLGAADALLSALELADRETVAHATEAVADLARPDACTDATPRNEPWPTDPAVLAKLMALDEDIEAVRAATAAGRYGTTIPAAREAVTAAIAIGHQTTVAEARLALATLLRRSGSAGEAAREAREAILAAENALHARTAARAWLELVAAQGDGGAWEDADATVRHAEAAVVRLGAPHDLLAAVHHAKGVVNTNLGRFDEADRNLRMALAVRTTLGAIEIARTRTAIGNVQRARGELQLALDTHRQALAMDEVSFGREHPAVARHHHNIAGVLRLMGRRGDAMKSYEASLAISRAALGDEHPSVALTRNSMGLVLLDGGDVAGARVHFEAALATLERVAHPERAAVLQNLGTALARLGRHAEALERLRAAHTIVVSTLGAGHARAGEVAALIRASEAAASGPKRASPSGPPPSAKPAGAYVPSQTLDPQ